MLCEQQSYVMIVKAQCVVHNCDEWKEIHGKRGEAASKGTLSHTSELPLLSRNFLRPVNRKKVGISN